jgi:hypothetical protein
MDYVPHFRREVKAFEADPALFEFPEGEDAATGATR